MKLKLANLVVHYGVIKATQQKTLKMQPNCLMPTSLPKEGKIHGMDGIGTWKIREMKCVQIDDSVKTC